MVFTIVWLVFVGITIFRSWIRIDVRPSGSELRRPTDPTDYPSLAAGQLRDAIA